MRVPTPSLRLSKMSKILDKPDDRHGDTYRSSPYEHDLTAKSGHSVGSVVVPVGQPQALMVKKPVGLSTKKVHLR